MGKCFALGAALLGGLICPAAERAEAWSSEWIEVTAENGVKDDCYPLQADPEKCSFRFRVMRNADNTIGVEAFVRDDRIVVDDCPEGSISCPTWMDDCLEVFFDGDGDGNPNTRGPDWNDNPTPCNAGGEYAIAANGATQSDYASAKKCFGSLWGGFAEPWFTNGCRRIGTHYRLWFTWDCLARAAPPPGEKVPLKMTVCIHDDDDGGACDYVLYWKGNPKYPFADESAFGEIVLGKIPERGPAEEARVWTRFRGIQDGRPPICVHPECFGWWSMGNQVGTALAKGHPVLAGLPHEGTMTPLLFSIVKDWAHELSRKEVTVSTPIIVGEGRKDCHLYLGEMKCGNGKTRQIAAFGSCKPEGSAILDGLIGALRR